MNGKPKARRYSFDAETEAWLEARATDGKSVQDVVKRLTELEDARVAEFLDPHHRAFVEGRDDLMDLYSVSKAGPQIGLDES